MKKLLALMMISINCYAAEWERIETYYGEGWSRTPIVFFRLNVPHGWLLWNGHRAGIEFYPDEQHEWK